ncbi:MAG: hypothetical protein ACI9CA_002058 [Natronomonas sp.]|jgi:hypothetical protein
MSDRFIRALTARSRRWVLDQLRDEPAETWLSLDTLATRHPDATERARIVLYHRDLPVLAAVDLIEWDRDAETVTRGPAFDRGVALLDRLRAEDAD